MSKFKQLIKKKSVMSMMGVVVFVLAIAGILPNVFASTAYYMPDALVELDGVNDGTVTISFNTPEEDSFANVRGSFDTLIGYDMEHIHFTLTGMSTGGDLPSTSIQNNTVADGLISWLDWTTPAHVAERGQLLSATYTVDKDTPAGNHSICLRNIWIASENSDWDTLNINSVCANIIVTRDEGTQKPSQKVVFRDSDNNEIGPEGITKYYGDEDFTVTKEVTLGDGNMEYHPDDDGTGSIAYTVPGGDLVGVGVPGDMDICAWMSETDDYAATKVCYTVHVLKRPIEISGVTIADKVYDGTRDADVTSVSFIDRGLGDDEYNATAEFGTASAGENKAIQVTVELTGGAEELYVLNSSTYDTTRTISPYSIGVGNVQLVGSGTYTYDPDGVEPEVLITAPGVYSGTYTLFEGQDYTISYSNNTSVGTGWITINGIDNFTTGAEPLMISFTIEKQGIINENLIIPSSIVEGHILDADEVRVNINGRDLTRCEVDGASDCDYVLSMDPNTGILGDNVHVVVEGRNNYSGTAVGDVTVEAKMAQTVTIGDVTNTTVNKVYGDAAFTYTATTTGNGDITYSSTDTDVAVVDEESGTVTIVGVGDAEIYATAAETSTYAQGSAKYTVSVSKGAVTIVSATIANKTYDGTTDATVSDASLNESSLVFDTDFTATATFNNANVGDRVATVNFTLSSDAFAHYCFVVNETECVNTAAFITNGRIDALTLGSENTTSELSSSSYGYDGSAKEPEAVVKVDLDGDSIKETPLTSGTDYTISYDDNVNAGTATATITGTGNYTGSLPALEYTINPATVTNVTVSAGAQTYTGSALEPTVTVTGTANGNEVTFTSDDFTVATHEDFVGAGDYTVTVNSKSGSNYSIPTTSGTFTINRADSGEPAEMSANFRIETGSALSALGERTEGFSWEDDSTLVTVGSASYPATYIKNNDSANYLTTNLSVPVYGLTRITVSTDSSDGGTATASAGSYLEGDEVMFTLSPESGYELAMVTLNGVDKTGEVVNGKLTVIAGTDNMMVVASYRRAYEVIEGAGQKHIRGVDGTAMFEIDADYTLFENGGAVYVDGVLVDPENYDSWENSTVIQFTADYMNSLAVGEHTLAVEFGDGGIARTTFVIGEEESEEPGGSTNGETDGTGDGAEEGGPAKSADTGVFTSSTGGAVATGLAIAMFTGMAGAVCWIVVKNKEA